MIVQPDAEPMDRFAALVDTFTIVDISAGADRLQVQLQQGAPVVQGGAQQLPGEQLQHGRGGHTGVYQQDGGQEKLIVWLLNRHKHK